MGNFPTEKCRTCQALIVWAVTDRGKDMPVDAHTDPKGNIALTPEGKVLSARVVPAHLAFGRKDLRLSHFVKCPDAPKWRQRR